MYHMAVFQLLAKGNGGAMRDRTADLLDANQALSQLSYSPIVCQDTLLKRHPTLAEPTITGYQSLAK